MKWSFCDTHSKLENTIWTQLTYFGYKKATWMPTFDGQKKKIAKDDKSTTQFEDETLHGKDGMRGHNPDGNSDGNACYITKSLL